MSNKLLILDFPIGYKFGIDLKYYTTGHNFKGVKNIPNGIHYIYYGVSDDFCNTGFFIKLNGNEICVKKWSKEDEDLLDYTPTDEDKQRYDQHKDEISQYLGSYEMENHKKWWSLTSSINLQLIYQLEPTCKRISSVDQFISHSSTTNDRKVNQPPKLDNDGLVELEIDPKTAIKFTKIPKYLFPSNLSDKTAHMLDKSFMLNSMLIEYAKFSDFDNSNSESFLLGELQYAFITYCLSYKMDALEQWLSIIDLVCSSAESAIKDRPGLYRGFVSVLHRQLQLTEDDFADISQNSNKFFMSLKRLFDVLEDLELSINDELNVLLKGLKVTLEHKYDWDFSEEIEDELPVIVDLNA